MHILPFGATLQAKGEAGLGITGHHTGDSEPLVLVTHGCALVAQKGIFTYR